MPRSKKKFTVYGNCQAYALAMQLLSHPAFAERYTYVPLQPCFSISKTDIDTWLESNKGSIDLLVSQNLKPSWRGDESWDVSRVASTLKKSGIVLQYADIYYRGTNPFLAYPSTLERAAHCDYVDLVSLMLAAYGFNDPSLCSRIYIDPNLLSVTEIEMLHTICESESSRRSASLDIDPWNKLGELCRNAPAFFTFNHPSTTALNEFARAILAKLEIEEASDYTLPPEILDGVQFPHSGSYARWYSSFALDTVSTTDQSIVRLENHESMDLPAYFTLALNALNQAGAEALWKELDTHRHNKVSLIVIQAIERALANHLAISPATLVEIGKLNSKGIPPDFLLTKTNPQSTGFMVDIATVMRETMLPQHLHEGMSVLDLGAKTGAGSQLLGYMCQKESYSKLKFEVTCADLDQTFVEYSAAANPHVEYLRQDVFKANRVWDVVVCSHVIEHVPDPIRFIEQLQKIAKKYVFLAFPYGEPADSLIEGHLHTISHELIRALKPITYRIYEGLYWSESMCAIAVLPGLTPDNKDMK